MKRITIVLLCFVASWVSAQQLSPVKLAQKAIEENKSSWQLTDEDISGLLVSDQYVTQHNGVTHIYFQQTAHGIPVHNAVTSVHIDADGKPHLSKNRFYSDAASLTNATVHTLSEGQAVLSAAKEIGVDRAQLVEKTSQLERGNTSVVFEGSNISNSDIKVRPTYHFSNGKLNLAWDLAIDDKESADYMSYKVDALDGKIIDAHNWTVYCQVGHVHKGCGHLRKSMEPEMKPIEEVITSSGVSGSYRVFPLPAESPSHGSHDLISTPHIVEASPFGWHDVDGDGEADYTITRGNNVHAYPDVDDLDRSQGNEPDGGAALNFDFPYDPDIAPINNLDAATTNLFYMNNMMHDICYLFGFDEASGNFQTTNHSGLGRGGDHVNAEAQDGGGTNNANFATPGDGGNGRMQMFLWNSGGEVFQVLEPGPIASGYETGEADFGPNIIGNNVDITAEIVEAFDASRSNPSFCCGGVINGEDLDGKIALIDRGGCFFDLKVRNCEDAGAVAVIICNFDPNPEGMTASGTVTEPTIPVVMIGQQACATIRPFAGRGAVGRLKAPNANLQNLDGDFDNGIIAHEYGHGISNRLTGGPNAAGCLGGAEQMGEGWSDFFSLITTVEPGDAEGDPRGIGTYAQRQSPEGSGIRPRPYTTDMSINEMTYSFVANSNISQPHGIGSVWCTMLWDLYWALSNEYGFDPDYKNVNAGNNIAIQLVMDGMKLQACNPGFVDGRDAILLADSINNEAANSCLIWNVFARRGLGYYADQGSSASRSDGFEDFETAPICQNKIRIIKSAENLIEAGDEINYTIEVSNNQAPEAVNVIVKDIIPNNCNYVTGSSNVPASINGSEITFELGNMMSLEATTITYKVESGSTGSATLWLDDFENGEDNWDIEVEEGFTIWYLQDEYFNSGENAFFTENQDGDADSYLFQFDPIQINLDNPGVRFFHWYSTSGEQQSTEEDNYDGGIVEISVNDQGFEFVAPDKMLRNGYNSPLPYGTFVLPNLSGFSGNSQDFVDTYIDLEEYKGEEVQIRFRFGTEALGAGPGTLPVPAGWVVDDVEFLDLLFYSTEVCVTDDSGSEECASLPGKGTLVEPNFKVDNTDLAEDVEQLVMYPNPAQDVLKLKLDVSNSQESDINILSLDGKIVATINAPLREGTQMIKIPVDSYGTGTYIIEIITEKGSTTKQWIKL